MGKLYFCINHGKDEKKTLPQRTRPVLASVGQGENPLKLFALRALCGEKVFALYITITEKLYFAKLCGILDTKTIEPRSTQRALRKANTQRF